MKIKPAVVKGELGVACELTPKETETAINCLFSESGMLPPFDSVMIANLCRSAAFTKEQRDVVVKLKAKYKKNLPLYMCLSLLYYRPAVVEAEATVTQDAPQEPTGDPESEVKSDLVL